MKEGRSVRLTGGFTILEVMIFLIVTGVLLVAAMSLLSGQQNRTAFRQSIRENESQFKTTINEVASGFYPNNGNFSCSVSPGGIPTFTSATTTEQGQNEDCLFLGKVVRVNPGGTSYSIYTIAGRRLASGTEVTQLQDANPRAIARFSGDPVNTPDVTQTVNLPSDIQITKVVSISTAGAQTTIDAFGFMMSVGKTSGGDLVSGAQAISLVPLPNPAPNDNDFKTGVSGMQQVHVGSAKTIVLCIRQGGTGGAQGAIVFGSQGRQLSTEVIIGAPPSGYTCPA